MASKKEIKQDIKELVGEVVADCIQYIKAHPGKSEPKIDEIVSEILKLRKDLILRANHVEKSYDSKAVKAYYHAIIKDLIEKTDNAFKKLSALPH